MKDFNILFNEWELNEEDKEAFLKGLELSKDKDRLKAHTFFNLYQQWENSAQSANELSDIINIIYFIGFTDGHEMRAER